MELNRKQELALIEIGLNVLLYGYGNHASKPVAKKRVVKKQVKKKRGMSKEGRAKIAAMMKKRWREAKKANRTSLAK